MPRALNHIVAAYLIVVGLPGLFGGVRNLEANRANGSNSGFNKPQAPHLLQEREADTIGATA